MADEDRFAMTVSRQQSIALALLVVAHAVFNLLLNPTGASSDEVSELLALPLMGANIAQPMGRVSFSEPRGEATTQLTTCCSSTRTRIWISPSSTTTGLMS